MPLLSRRVDLDPGRGAEIEPYAAICGFPFDFDRTICRRDRMIVRPPEGGRSVDVEFFCPAIDCRSAEHSGRSRPAVPEANHAALAPAVKTLLLLPLSAGTPTATRRRRNGFPLNPDAHSISGTRKSRSSENPGESRLEPPRTITRSRAETSDEIHRKSAQRGFSLDLGGIPSAEIDQSYVRRRADVHSISTFRLPKSTGNPPPPHPTYHSAKTPHPCARAIPAARSRTQSVSVGWGSSPSAARYSNPSSTFA